MIRLLLYLFIFITFVKCVHTNNTLYALTYAGNLFSINKSDGFINWKVPLTPFIKSNINLSSNISLYPNPKDGTLYIYQNDNLRLLPFTIPELVQMSPFISKKLVLYSGEKIDYWYILNASDGTILSSMSMSNIPSYKCPTQYDLKLSHIHLTKTEYILRAFDTITSTFLWNMTYSSYKVYTDSIFSNLQLNSVHESSEFSKSRELLDISKRDFRALNSHENKYPRVENDTTFISDSDFGLFLQLNGTKSISWVTDLHSPIIHLFSSVLPKKHYVSIKNDEEFHDLFEMIKPLNFISVLANDFISFSELTNHTDHLNFFKFNSSFENCCFPSWDWGVHESPIPALYLDSRKNFSRCSNSTTRTIVSLPFTENNFAIPVLVSGNRNKVMKKRSKYQIESRSNLPLIEYKKPINSKTPHHFGGSKVVKSHSAKSKIGRISKPIRDILLRIRNNSELAFPSNKDSAKTIKAAPLPSLNKNSNSPIIANMNDEYNTSEDNVSKTVGSFSIYHRFLESTFGKAWPYSSGWLHAFPIEVIPVSEMFMTSPAYFSSTPNSNNPSQSIYQQPLGLLSHHLSLDDGDDNSPDLNGGHHLPLSDISSEHVNRTNLELVSNNPNNNPSSQRYLTLYYYGDKEFKKVRDDVFNSQSNSSSSLFPGRQNHELVGVLSSSYHGKHSNFFTIFISLYTVLLSLTIPFILIWLAYSHSSHTLKLLLNFSNLPWLPYTTRIGLEKILRRFLPIESTAVIQKIGKIKFDVRDVIGYGSLGTTVFTGSFEERPCAIKRLHLMHRPLHSSGSFSTKTNQGQSLRIAQREIDTLLRCDRHDNVIRYFAAETYGNFIYIALELCQFSFEAFAIFNNNNTPGYRANNECNIMNDNEITKKTEDSAHNSGNSSSSKESSRGFDGGTNKDLYHLIKYNSGSGDKRHCIIWERIMNYLTPKDLCEQMLNGITYLHSLNIVHRDIKPHNVLITLREPLISSRSIRVVISDFGISKFVDSSFALGDDQFTSALAPGTLGWTAREIILLSDTQSCTIKRALDLKESLLISHLVYKKQNGHHRHTQETFGERKMIQLQQTSPKLLIEFYKSADCFSAGCVLYYVLSGGGHPFGDDVYVRQLNILADNYDLSSLNYHLQEHEEDLVCQSLLTQMLSSDSKIRPTLKRCLTHYYFWDAEKRLQFLMDFSDIIEKVDPYESDLVHKLEKQRHLILGDCLDWKSIIDPELGADLRKFRNYRTDSIRDLLRALRNKKHHYQELPDSLKLSLGRIPEQFLRYFTQRFPFLLTHIYLTFETYYLSRQSMADYTLQPMMITDSDLEHSLYKKYYT